MVPRRFAALTLLALLAVAGARAQEAEQQDAPSCDGHVEAAVKFLKADLKTSNDRHSRAVKDVQACTGAKEELQATLKAKVSELEAASSNLQRTSSELTALQAAVAELESKLKQAMDKSASPADLDLPTLATAAVSLARKGGIAAAQEAQAVFQELKSGRIDRLSGLLSSGLAHVTAATRLAAAFVTQEVQEHTPPAVKAKVAEVAGKAQALWKEHVTDAEWAQPLLAQLRQVVGEVERLVSRTVTTTPALAPLADPVTIQLLVYAVFVLPLAVLLLLPCLLMSGGSKRSAAGAAPSAVGRKANKKSKAARA